jgi:hypothetical protein
VWKISSISFTAGFSSTLGQVLESRQAKLQKAGLSKATPEGLVASVGRLSEGKVEQIGFEKTLMLAVSLQARL